MKYELVYTKRAVRDISGLDQAAKERIRGTLERYAQSPFNYAKKMVYPAMGTIASESVSIGLSSM